MNRLLELQRSLAPGKKRNKPTLQPERSRSYGASYEEDVFNRPAFTFSADPALQETGYGTMFSKTYYDWPDKFGTGDATYDAEAAKWITDNIGATPFFAELNVVFKKDGRRHQFKAATTDLLAKKKEGYTPLGHNYEGHPSRDPKPNWGISDAKLKATYDALYEELKLEGGISSANAWDDQQVTLGWGFSVKYDGKKHYDGLKILKYNMDASADFKKAMLEVGLAVKNDEILYFAPTPPRILKGDAAMTGFKWNPKVLSRMITELEKIPAINSDVNARVFKEARASKMPPAVFSWPHDSLRLAMLLSHWAPAGISWAAISGSGGDVATIVKSFSRNFHKNYPGGYPTAYALSTNANGSIYANDIRTVLARRGNRAFIKAADAGKISSIDKSAFTADYKTDAKYKDYVFVELSGKVYLLP